MTTPAADVTNADASIFTRMGESLSSQFTVAYDKISKLASTVSQKALEGGSYFIIQTSSMSNRAVSFCSETYNANPKITIAAIGTLFTAGTVVALYTFRDQLPDCVQNVLPGKNQGS